MQEGRNQAASRCINSRPLPSGHKADLPGHGSPQTQEQRESYPPVSSRPCPCSCEDRTPHSCRNKGQQPGPPCPYPLGSQRRGQGLQLPSTHLQPLPEPPTLAEQVSLPPQGQSDRGGGRVPVARDTLATSSISEPTGALRAQGFTPDSLGIMQNIHVRGMCVACVHTCVCCVCVRGSTVGTGEAYGGHTGRPRQLRDTRPSVTTGRLVGQTLQGKGDQRDR